MWGYGLNRAGSGYGQLAGTCDCGNEPSGSIKFGVFLDFLKTCQLLRKDSAPWSDVIDMTILFLAVWYRQIILPLSHIVIPSFSRFFFISASIWFMLQDLFQYTFICYSIQAISPVLSVLICVIWYHTVVSHVEIFVTMCSLLEVC